MLKNKIFQIPTCIITVLFLLVFSLFSFGIAQETKGSAQDVGELHNKGMLYIKEQLCSRTDKKIPGYIDIKKLTTLYFAQIGWKFVDFKVPIGEDPIILIDSNKDMSIELKSALKSVFGVLESQPSLTVLNKSLDQIMINNKGKLRKSDQQKVDVMISVAKSSAKLWATQSEGGMDTIKDFIKCLTNTPASTAKKKTNWWKLVRSDLSGALAGLPLGPEGAAAGAIIGTAIEAIDQATGS